MSKSNLVVLPDMQAVENTEVEEVKVQEGVVSAASKMRQACCWACFAACGPLGWGFTTALRSTGIIIRGCRATRRPAHAPA